MRKYAGQSTSLLGIAFLGFETEAESAQKATVANSGANLPKINAEAGKALSRAYYTSPINDIQNYSKLD